jgi:hypothetical protein
MITYDEFQSSTKIISQENLIYVCEIFITVHTAVIKQICGTLSVTQQSTHQTSQTAVQKTKSAAQLYKTVHMIM